MPDSTENTYGYAYGECAMSRGIGAVSREILINRYTEQVLDDNPPPGILIFKNVSDQNLRDAIAKLEQERSTDFGSRWGDTIRLYGLDTDKLPEVESVAYSNPPEGFDYESMKNLNAKEIAAAVGVDIQDFWELTQSNMGTATQSAVLHEKSKGKALGRILKSLERVINQALPESLQFEFKYRDDQEDQAEATKATSWIANAAQLSQLGLPQDAITRLLVNQVPAIRDVMTDESGEIIRLPDDDPKTDEQITLSTQSTVESAESQTTPQDAETVDDTEKALRDTRQSFEDVFVRIVNQTNLSDVGSRALVGQILRQQLQSHGEDVWLDGQRSGGNETAVIDKDAERSIAVWRAQQSPFVSKFTKELFSKEFTSKEIISRARMWVNKSLNPLYYKSLDAAAGNSHWMWVVNPVKEHCETCVKMNGQIHKMKDYIKSGVLPQSPKLECGGYQCGCSLTPSDLPSRGTFTRGRGGLRGAIRNIFQAARGLFKKEYVAVTKKKKPKFVESQHPRDESGQFGSGGGADSGGSDDEGGEKRDYQNVGRDREFDKKWENDMDNIKKEPGPPPGERVIKNTTGYTDENYRKINGTLRGTSSDLPDLETMESIQDLDNLTNRRMLDRDIVSFRSDDGAGLPNGGDLTDAQFKKLKGSTFQDNGFTSTATSTELGDQFGAVKYEYRIPKGSRGAYLNSVSKYPNESEFLLGRRTASNIVDARIENGKRTLVLEVIPDG
jgi:hypothetical protein